LIVGIICPPPLYTGYLHIYAFNNLNLLFFIGYYHNGPYLIAQLNP